MQTNPSSALVLLKWEGPVPSHRITSVLHINERSAFHIQPMAPKSGHNGKLVLGKMTNKEILLLKALPLPTVVPQSWPTASHLCGRGPTGTSAGGRGKSSEACRTGREESVGPKSGRPAAAGSQRGRGRGSCQAGRLGRGGGGVWKWSSSGWGHDQVSACDPKREGTPKEQRCQSRASGPLNLGSWVSHPHGCSAEMSAGAGAGADDGTLGAECPVMLGVVWRPLNGSDREG